MKESDVQRQILDDLTPRGIFHYRNNSGAFVDSQKHFYRFGAVGTQFAFENTTLKSPARCRRIALVNCSVLTRLRYSNTANPAAMTPTSAPSRLATTPIPFQSDIRSSSA